MVQVRGHFTSVEAAKKLIYLALRESTKSCGNPIPQWSKAKRELAIHFGHRFNASNGWVLPNKSGK